MSSDHIWPILFFVSLAGNLILLFYRPLLRLLRRGEEVSEDEIMAMVEEGEESGAIQSNEKTLIENVFDFDTMTARDVMVHRTDMVTLDVDDDDETVMEAIRTSGLSRFPVYQEDVDDIVGVLSTREYLLNCRLPQPKPMKDLLRPAYFVPETMPLQALLEHFIKHRSYIAVVIDEFGGTAGIISLEDVLEQIFGEIEDEHDEQDMIEKQVDENEYVFSCRLEVKYLNERYGLGIEESREYDTLAGYIISHLDGIPSAGQSLTVDGLEIRVLRTTRSRIELARVRRL